MAPPEGRVEELSSCLPGDKVIVWYSDDSVYHERVLLWKTGESTWYIVTPDHDVYVEDFNDPANGPARFHIKGLHFKYYSRLSHGVYRFDDELSEDELKKFIEEALDDLGYDVLPPGAWCPGFARVGKNQVSLSKMLGQRVVPRAVKSRGKGVMDGPVPGLQGLTADLAPELVSEVFPIDPAPPGKIWVSFGGPGDMATLSEVLVSKGQGIRTGSLEGLAHIDGQWLHVRLIDEQQFNSLVSKGNAPTPSARLARDLGVEEASGSQEKAATSGEQMSEDARTLYVDYDDEGERFKEWRQVTLESREYNYKDWPLDGPMTTHHFIKHTYRHGGDPKRWLSEWMRAKQIQEGDRISFEMKILIESLYIAGTYDQLNVSGLASVEILVRRIQAIVDAYSAGPIPDWNSAKIMTLYRSPEDAISPQLKTWAARRNKEELDLAQTRAKVREGRRVAILTEESAASAVADGVLPAGGPKAKAKQKGKGRGLEPPANP